MENDVALWKYKLWRKQIKCIQFYVIVRYMYYVGRPPFFIKLRFYCICTVNSRYLEVVGTSFYTFKLPEVQINLWLEKAIKMYF